MTSRNRLINGPNRDESEEEPEFRAFLYHIETGESLLLVGNDKKEEHLEKLSSGEWVDTPAKTNTGRYRLKPKECKFYKNRVCSLCPEQYAKATGDYDGVKNDEKKKSKTLLVDPINDSNLDPPLVAPPKTGEYKPPKKHISQMNRAELEAEINYRNRNGEMIKIEEKDTNRKLKNKIIDFDSRLVEK